MPIKREKCPINKKIPDHTRKFGRLNEKNTRSNEKIPDQVVNAEYMKQNSSDDQTRKMLDKTRKISIKKNTDQREKCLFKRAMNAR